MDIHLHIGKLVVNLPLEKIDTILQTVIDNNLKLKKMPTKAEFDAAVADIKQGYSDTASALDNIGDDITRLTDKLTNGGLTPDEEAATLTELQGLGAQAKDLAAKAKAIADKTPEDAAPPTEG